jgi:hypothetical protein
LQALSTSPFEAQPHLTPIDPSPRIQLVGFAYSQIPRESPSANPKFLGKSVV